MRILVLADIHSNWPALEAVARAEPVFDACLVAGDLVDYGGDAAACIDWVREHATACIRGNHDHAVAQRVPAKGGPGFRSLAAATRPFHWEQLDADRLRFLAELPVTDRVRLADRAYFLVHGTPRDPLDEYLRPNPDAWRERFEGIDTDFACVGHTHVPTLVDLGTMQVLNPGSVGQPRDGDPRAAYAIVEDGVAELCRVEYDVEAAVASLRAAGVDGAEMRFAENVLRTGVAQRRTDTESVSAEDPDDV